jgi:hypothetical protein
MLAADWLPAQGVHPLAPPLQPDPLLPVIHSHCAGDGAQADRLAESPVVAAQVTSGGTPAG